uniref:Tail specific protease domain-containing protein n=1 Tax=Denticeps clupeoides TaxID=299321 RepID=A0AAY4CRJ9_9TELE
AGGSESHRTKGLLFKSICHKSRDIYKKKTNIKEDGKDSSFCTAHAALPIDNLAVKLNYELQSVAEDPRLIIKMAKNSPLVVQDDPELETIPDDQSFLQALAESVFKVRILPGNTGYVRFDRFVDAMLLQKMEVQMVRNVWEPIKGTDNLIIDLRFNTGGPSDSLSILLSYLHDVSSKLQLFTIYDRVQNTTTDYHTLPDILGPSYGSTRGVYVLTSYHTISAGEEFAYLIQSLHRGTIVGEITSGNLLHSKSFNVKNTDIVITLPVMNFIDNNDECWLGGGVVPDAIVLADEAEEQALEVIQFHQEIRSLVEEVGELLGMHYALPEIAVNVKKTLHTKWTDGFYRPVIDYESLASQLTADLQEISADHRLHVFYCDVEPESMLEVPKIPTADEASYIINTLFKADVLVGNIGYLRFDMMADIAVVKAIGSQLVQVWNKLVNTYALIIDLRYNIGAYSSALPLLCTYLFDPEPLTHLYTIFDHATNTTTRVMTLPEVLGQRYGPTKEIYILTSHMTGSAAEAFTRTMKDLKRATVIGEPTVGGSLSSGTYQIGNSILYASIPNQVVLSADNGQVWGVSGVEPHVVAQGTDALKVAKNIIAAKN